MILIISIAAYIILSITLLFCIKLFREDFLGNIVIRFTKESITLVKNLEFVTLKNKFFNVIVNALSGGLIIFLVVLFFLLFFSLIPLLSIIYIPTYIKERKKEKEEEKEEKEWANRPKPPRIVLLEDKVMGPNYAQIIYIEPYFDGKLNDYFTRNYQRINQKLNPLINSDSGKKYNFIYPPLSFNNETFQKIMDYNRPDVKSEPDENTFKELANKFYKAIIENAELENLEQIKPAFIHLVDRGWDKAKGRVIYNAYSYFPLEYTTDEELSEKIDYYIDHLSTRDVVLYCPVEYSTPFDADEHFGETVNRLTDEIRQRIEQLHAMGVNDFVIKNLIFEPPRLSRLRITADYRILLTDYNKEIKMTPLPKAVFFFFLRHPEGVIFKHLIDYKDELLEIYKNLTVSEDEQKIKESIDSITDSTKNSINEKCSRIQEAFLHELCEEITEYYRISIMDKKIKLPDGSYREYPYTLREKYIKLDRSLVDDESGIVIKKR